MDLLQNAYIQKYVSEMTENLQITFPHIPSEKLEAFIKKRVRETCVDQNVLIQNTYTKMQAQQSLLSILHWIETENPIIAGNGSFYVQHDVNTAPANQMLIHQKKQRSILKNKSFECRDRGDMNGYVSFHLGQGNEKIKMNSYYGAMGQSKSFQYNVSAAGAITSQGRSIISTTMWFDEAFLANNVIFETFDDIVHYIKLILREEIHLELYQYIEYIPSDLEIVEYLLQHYESNVSRRFYGACLISMLQNMSTQEKIKIYYKNNLHVFLEKNPKARQIVLDMVTSPVSYMNPYEIPEEFKGPFDILWQLVAEFVYMEQYIVYNKIDKYVNHTRKVVLYSDTDSVFIYTGLWLFKIIEFLSGKQIKDINMEELQKNDVQVLKIINIVTNLIYIGIHTTYKTLCTNVNIFGDYQKYVSIKNEFLFDRFVMFDIKKNYIYREVVNEGNIIKNPHMDVKGGNLNPKAKNKLVTNRIKSIVEDVTMNHDKIYPELLLKKVFEFRDEIVTSLRTGSLDYLIPTKVKNPEQYDNPYSQFKFRGVEAYRIAEEDPSIQLPGSFNVIDVKMETLEELSWLEENFPVIYDRLKVGVFGNDRLKKYGITYICIPMKLNKIPDWIVPYIDTDSIWRKHLNPIIALLPAMGISQDSIRTSTYYSTILKI